MKSIAMKLNFTIIFLSLFLLNACVFFGPSSEKLYSNALLNKPYDVIIVPGFPYDSAIGEMPRAMKGRVYWSKFLFEKGITKNIIYSGSAVYTPYCESEIMALYGKEIGIPSANIFVEKRAEHSTENVYYSYYLAKSMGFEKVAVATDPFQAKLLRSYPRKIKVKIDFIPFIIDTLKIVDKGENVKIDAELAKVPFFESIVDRQSRYKRIWGTLGKNVKHDKLDPRKGN